MDEWLGERVVYDLGVDSAEVAPSKKGFRVTAGIRVAKTVTRGAADEPRSADGESLDVAVYDDAPGSGRLLYAGKHLVTGGRIALTVDLPEPPAYVVVDPLVRRIDRDRTNNTRRVVAARERGSLSPSRR